MSGKLTPDYMMSASRLPALLGLSRYQTPNDELQYSINASKGLPREDKQNEAMAWGDRIERLILQETAKRLGWAHGRGQKIRTDMDAGIIVVGQDEIMLDGYGVLEAKLTAVSPEEMPALYRGPVQLQAQMDIMQARWGAVAVLYQGTVLRIFLFEPHKQTLETIKTAVLEFQNKIEKYKATGEIDYYPPANSKDADRMYPAADEAAVVNLPGRAEQLADQILAANAAIKEAEGKRSEAETELKAMLGQASKGTVGRFEIRWPMRSYKATPEKVVPAKDAYSIRQSTLSIKEAL
jgi:predicted phage-related endonuclease